MLVLSLLVVAGCDDKKNDASPTLPTPNQTASAPSVASAPPVVASASSSADIAPPGTRGLPTQVDEAANASREIGAANYKKELESLAKEIKELK